MTHTLHTADVMDALAAMTEASVDAILTDPPYGIRFMGKAWDGAEIERQTQEDHAKRSARKDGRNVPVFGASVVAGSYDLSLKGNRAFQSWCTEWATAILRVLKPGGFLLAFGGTRTFHRLTCAIEDAGFEIRDDIARWLAADERIRLFWKSLNPEQRGAFAELVAPGEVLGFLYGSGFPKSHSISKAIDKAAGAEREVVGPLPLPASSGFQQGKNNWETASGTITAPATPAAQQWSGYGTALKPAWEPVVVAMKPLDGTFAENAVKHGVAGINIDGGRVGTEDVSSSAVRKPGCQKYGGQNHRPHHDGQAAPTVHGSTSGRWPANLILQHHPECVQVGVKRVKGGPSSYEQQTESCGYGGKAGFVKGKMSTHYADPDGLETVESWTCHPDCPVGMLGEQSGVESDRPAKATLDGTGSGSGVKGASTCYGKGRLYLARTGYQTTGTASRFLYTAKSHKRERNAGLIEYLPRCQSARKRYQQDIADSIRRPIVKQLERQLRKVQKSKLADKAKAKACRALQYEIDRYKFGWERRAVNRHPTVKPLALNRYLATLLLPPPRDTPRRILIPFAGSGSEMIGAMLAGWDEVVGIEKEKEYCTIAQARLQWWQKRIDKFGCPLDPATVLATEDTPKPKSPEVGGQGVLF